MCHVGLISTIANFYTLIRFSRMREGTVTTVTTVTKVRKK